MSRFYPFDLFRLPCLFFLFPAPLDDLIRKADINIRMTATCVMLSSPKLLEELITRQVLLLKFLQALDVLLERATTHGPFLVHPPLAARQNVEILFVLRHFDLDRLTDFLPGLAQEAFLQF